MIGIVYHDEYNKYGLGLDYPLIGDKPRQTMEFFEKKGILNEMKVFKPKKATEKNLLLIHNPRYIEHSGTW